VTYEDQHGDGNTITILGIDEADSLNAQVSWVSPDCPGFAEVACGRCGQVANA
jgi:hypothetical protein